VGGGKGGGGVEPPGQWRKVLLCLSQRTTFLTSFPLLLARSAAESPQNLHLIGRSPIGTLPFSSLSPLAEPLCWCVVNSLKLSTYFRFCYRSIGLGSVKRCCLAHRFYCLQRS